MSAASTGEAIAASPAGVGSVAARRFALFVLYAFVVTTPFSTATGSIFGVSLLVLGCVALVADASARAAIPRVVWIALAGMIGWSALAAATAAPYPSEWETWYEELWIKLMLVAATALLVVVRPRLDRLLLTYLVAASVVAALGAFELTTGSMPFRDEISPSRGGHWEIEAFYSHHLTYGGHVAVLWAMAIAYVLFGPERGSGRRWRIAVVCAALLTFGLYGSYARSAQLGAMAGLGVLVWMLPARRRWIAIAVVAVGLVGALMNPTMRERYVHVFDNTSNETTRWLLWQSSLDGIETRPWTGFGPGNFGDLMANHEVAGEYESRAHSHNDYLMHAVNAGWPMLGFALLLAGGLVVVLVRDRDGPNGVDWIVVGALAGHVALMVAGVAQVFQSDDEVELTVYFVLACALAHRALRRAPAAGPVSS